MYIKKDIYFSFCDTKDILELKIEILLRKKNPFAYPYNTLIFIVRWFLKSFMIFIVIKKLIMIKNVVFCPSKTREGV